MATKEKRSSGEGSIRRLDNGIYECIMQSKYLNPQTGKAKRFKRTGKNEKDAVKNCRIALKAWEKQFEAGHIVKVNRKKTFGEYMDDFLEKEVKPNIVGSTYKSYVYTLNSCFHKYKISKLQLGALNTVEFEIYFDSLIHDKSYRTAETPIQLAKRCCNWLYGKSLLEEDYAAFAKTKKQKKDEFFREQPSEIRKEVFTNEDIIKFYDAYKNNVSEYCVLIIFMLETMTRAQEVLPLTLDDINLENNTIHIRSAVSERFIDNDKTKGIETYIKVTKTTKERMIYMTPLAKEAVLYMIEQTKLRCRQNPNNFLYPSFLKHGKMRSMDAFEVQFKVICDKIGVDRDVHIEKRPDGKTVNIGLNTHDLRHTAITLANTAKGANVINTALMAGHTAIRTENIYTHNTIEAQKSIKKASELVLGLGEKEEVNNSKKIDDAELYNMYLKLKSKFENKED